MHKQVMHNNKYADMSMHAHGAPYPATHNFGLVYLIS